MNELQFSGLSDQAAVHIHTLHGKGAISFLFRGDSSQKRL